MLRPREDPDQELVFERLLITPEPTRLRIERDRLGNFVAIARFSGAASELCFDSEVLVARPTQPSMIDIPLPGLRPFPLRGRGSDGDVARWAWSFVSQGGWAGLDAMAAMNAHIHRAFAYRRRLESGVQSPEDTLASRSGACRDFAVLLVEAARILDLPARFVSGYVHCPEPDGSAARTSGGHTHAWAQVHTPEAGWVDLDPTSGRVGPDGLVRIAVVEHPRDAAPIQGVYHGAANDFLHMQVQVNVEAAPEATLFLHAPEPLPVRSVA